MLSVSVSPSALLASRHLVGAAANVDTIGQRVSSGLRVAGALDDASSFSIAQGVRGEIKAWTAIHTGLGVAAGALTVAVAGATGISELLGTLRERIVDYFAADTDRQPIVQNDIDALLEQIDLFANGATFNGLNLIDTDQPSLVFTPPPDQGTTFTLSGAGSNTHALGTTAGTVQVDYSATGSGGGQLRLIYDGSVVASTVVNPPIASGSLGFAYDALGPTSFTIQRTGGPNVDLDYAFTLTPTGLSGVDGDYKILKSLNGDHVDVQFRSLLAADIGLGTLNLGNVAVALGQVDAAEREVSQALGYYGAKHREVDQSRDAARRFTDAVSVGLGNIVDADLARESARLAAARVRDSLALEAFVGASRSRAVVLDLFA